MNEKRILFSQDEVRALMDGRMMMVIRPVEKIPCQCGNWLPCELSATTPEGFQTVGHSGRWSCESCSDEPVYCPFGAPGTRLWVAETLAALDDQNYSLSYAYYADGKMVFPQKTWDKYSDCIIPSTQMPRWASRLAVENVGVRVARAQDLTRVDCINTGATEDQPLNNMGTGSIEKDAFAESWQSRFGKKTGLSWDANPWCWLMNIKMIE